MVKKMKSTTDSSTSSKSNPLHSGHLAASVKESAQQIWLAGMGAFSKAQEEGTKVFEALVKEGMNLQKKTQGMAEEKFGEVTGKMSAMADTVTSKAGQNWDKLEAIFEQRTAKAMGKLGVPTAKDVADLVKRVDELAAKVAKMNGGAAPAKAAKAAKATKAPASVFSKAVKKAVAKAPAKKATTRARKTAAF
jgi:poly(hydroxyalkanoate) granule-associated protein